MMQAVVPSQAFRLNANILSSSVAFFFFFRLLSFTPCIVSEEFRMYSKTTPFSKQNHKHKKRLKPPGGEERPMSAEIR